MTKRTITFKITTLSCKAVYDAVCQFSCLTVYLGGIGFETVITDKSTYTKIQIQVSMMSMSTINEFPW